MKRGIFYSARRSDVPEFASELHDLLHGVFPGQLVRVDPLRMSSPQELSGRIEADMATCGLCVVVVGEEWLTGVDGEGNRRPRAARGSDPPGARCGAEA